MAGVSLERIEAMAPDQSSLVAARKLVKPGGWSGLAAEMRSAYGANVRVPAPRHIA